MSLSDIICLLHSPRTPRSSQNQCVLFQHDDRNRTLSEQRGMFVCEGVLWWAGQCLKGTNGNVFPPDQHNIINTQSSLCETLQRVLPQRVACKLQGCGFYPREEGKALQCSKHCVRWRNPQNNAFKSITDHTTWFLNRHTNKTDKWSISIWSTKLPSYFVFLWHANESFHSQSHGDIL